MISIATINEKRSRYNGKDVTSSDVLVEVANA
jgi:hypothetical protein